MQSHLLFRQLCAIFYLFFLLLIACTPMEGGGVVVTRVAETTTIPIVTTTPTVITTPSAIASPESSPTMTTASTDGKCAQPFADVTTAMVNVINEGVKEMEESGTSTLGTSTFEWQSQPWKAIANQTVAAGARFLDECTDSSVPLAEQPEQLDQLARLSKVIPEMEFTLPVEVADGGLLQQSFGHVYTPTTQLLDIDNDGNDELILHTQLAFFSEETIYLVVGGLSIAYFQGSNGWQGQIIWPVPHFVDKQPGTYPAFAGPQLTTNYFEAWDYFESQAGWEKGQWWHYFPEPVIGVLDAHDSQNRPYLVVSGFLYMPVTDITETAILRWDEAGLEVAMRLAWHTWCGDSPPWEIGNDGNIYLQSTPEFPEHGCNALPEHVFILD